MWSTWIHTNQKNVTYLWLYSLTVKVTVNSFFPYRLTRSVFFFSMCSGLCVSALRVLIMLVARTER